MFKAYIGVHKTVSNLLQENGLQWVRVREGEKHRIFHIFFLLKGYKADILKQFNPSRHRETQHEKYLSKNEYPMIVKTTIQPSAEDEAEESKLQ